MKEQIKEIYGKIFFWLFKNLPLQNKIVFSSFWGKKYGDNPKYISDELLNVDKRIKQVWLNNTGKPFENINSDIKVVKWGSIRMIYEMATAKIWIDSHTKPCWVRKRKDQFYIETWHGGLGMKKIEADMGDNLKISTKKQIKSNSKIADLFISNSSWLTNIYKRAFWYNGEILECGYPKNDIMFQNEKHKQIEKKIKAYYDITENKKILLYAPTFRDNEEFEYNIDLNKIYKELNHDEEKWVIIYKLHPLLVNSTKKIINEQDKIINATQYNDMQELIIASDILITDYSSCIFDIAMLYKPGFIFAQDVEEYSKERGLYFDIKKLPFPFSETNEELIKNIKNFNKEKYKKDLDNYFNEVGLKETGNATKQIVDIIKNICKAEEIKKEK